MIGHAVFLAARYLWAHPGRTLVLVLGLSVALFLPAFTLLAAERVEDRLLARAEASPVVIGRKGNEFDLTLAALYFRAGVRDRVPAGVAEAVEARGYGQAVPLHVRHTAGGVPLVGTELAYLEARGLTLAEGRRFALLAEVVAGADVARRFRLSPGDRVRSDLSNLYNIAGSYPLTLEVVGVLAPSGTPDDGALFADVKTAWALDGHLHGHEAVTEDNALPPSDETAPEDENLEATAALFLVDEVSDENRSTFHLHGDPGELPVAAVLVFPPDARARDQLLGDWALHETQQAVQPVEVVRTILGIVLQVRDGLLAWFGLVAVSTGAFFVLVLALSLRLRADELRLVRRLGAARGTVTAMVAAEVLLVALMAGVVATGATLAGLAVVAAWLGG